MSVDEIVAYDIEVSILRFNFTDELEKEKDLGAE